MGRPGASSEVEWVEDTQRRGPSDLEGIWTLSLCTYQGLSLQPQSPTQLAGGLEGAWLTQF